jgi:hypothetical protein
MNGKHEGSTVFGRCITINYYALMAFGKKRNNESEGTEKEVVAYRNLNHSQKHQNI